MSILKAMNIGLSGLAANGTAMSIIGDNISNVNTIGYKGSRANFGDVLAQTTLGIGDGVQLASVQQDFSQGSMELTGNALDLAISGRGFMMVNGVVDGSERTAFTRAGQFVLDSDGYISTMDGMKLQGYTADANGNIGGGLGDLQVGMLSTPPNATTEISTAGNLDPSAEIITGGFDVTDPGGTSSFSTSVTVYDSLGNEIPVDVYYTRTGPNQWEYNVVVDEEYTGGTAGTLQVLDTGTMTFDTDGELQAPTNTSFTFNPIGATQPQSITLEFEGSTQYAGENSMRALEQDGYAAGELRGVQIDPDGTIVGIFSNGENQTVGQVATADFRAMEGLERLGNNLWGETRASGEPLVGAPGSAGLGSVVSGALEQSNVDLAHQFVKMIAVQRGFQANSKTITTGDQMLQEVMMLKR